MPEYVYPTTAELKLIEQDLLPSLTMDDPIFKYFPIANDDNNFLLMWDQEDNYFGLQNIRGLNGQPVRVNRAGAKRYVESPGVYGDWLPIDEEELTLRAQYGTFGQPIVIDDLVRRLQDQLLNRRIARIKTTLWNLVVTGTLSVLGRSGTALANGAYTTQTFSAGTGWATAATSTPLADFRAVQLLAAGHSVSFSTDATAYMNQITANNMLSNTNANDLAGRRNNGIQVNGVAEANALLMKDGLPQVQIWDKGYIAENGAFTRFIPNNKVVVIGNRPNGAALGNYRMVKNAANPGGKGGPFTSVVTKNAELPPEIRVTDGHNGGPVIYFPSAIVVMSV